MLARALTVLSLMCATSLSQDLESVGSTIALTRLAPPRDLQAAGDHSGRDQDYHHTLKSQGGKGYKNFDSFHKKDGDSYGYEKHRAFGDGDKGGDGGKYHETSSYDTRGRKPKITAYHYETKTGTPRDYSNYNPETYEGDYTQIVPHQRQPQTSRNTYTDFDIYGSQEGEQYLPGFRKPVETNTAAKGREVFGMEGDAGEDDFYYGEGDGGGFYSNEDGFGRSSEEESYYYK